MPSGKTQWIFPLTAFLSRGKSPKIFSALRPRIAGQGPHRPHHLGNAYADLGIKHAREFRQSGGHQHPPSHGLSVQEASILRGLLQRMTKSVAQVQDAPQVRLALVAAHDINFHLSGLGDESFQQRRVPQDDTGHMACKPTEKIRTGKNPVLNRFIHT